MRNHEDSILMGLEPISGEELYQQLLGTIELISQSPQDQLAYSLESGFPEWEMLEIMLDMWHVSKIRLLKEDVIGTVEVKSLDNLAEEVKRVLSEATDSISATEQLNKPSWVQLRAKSKSTIEILSRCRN